MSVGTSLKSSPCGHYTGILGNSKKTILFPVYVSEYRSQVFIQIFTEFPSKIETFRSSSTFLKCRWTFFILISRFDCMEGYIPCCCCTAMHMASTSFIISVALENISILLYIVEILKNDVTNSNIVMCVFVFTTGRNVRITCDTLLTYDIITCFPCNVPHKLE